jgi:hypothetical protein
VQSSEFARRLKNKNKKMAKILIINKHSSGNYCEKKAGKLQTEKSLRSGFEIGKKGSIKIGLASVGFLVTFFIVFSSAFYLFQVNDLAVKGYDIRDLENKIGELEKENKKMQIREMELRSMYVIEKSAQDFNLVSPVNVTYLEVSSAVAIR